MAVLTSDLEQVNPFPIKPQEAAALMRAQARHVMGARSTVTALKAQVRELRRQFDESNAEILNRLDEAVADLAAKEQLMRELAVELFKETGSKAPGPGIEVKIYQEPQYQEPRAIEWSLEHKHMDCLSLNRTRFEAAAKVHRPEFVEWVPTPKASIAQDLSKALGTEVQP